MNAAAVFDARPSTVRIPPLRQRARAVVRSLGTLARDPGRLDQVLVLAETVNAEAIGRAIERLHEDPAGRALFAEQPRIDREHIDFDALRRLPEGTLGREYARFLDDNGITPDVFAKLPDVGDPRAAYIMLRMRQTHDLWHVLTGYSPDVRGEILLQAFTYGQTRAPSSLLLALFGTVRWPLRWPGHVKALRAALQHGKAAAFLPLFRWEEHWATPVSDLRARLSCPRLA